MLTNHLFTITTPLYYVNDRPHLGSCYTTIACDAISRFKRLEGKEVIFITGVDEHGQKIQRTAESNSISAEEHCNNISSKYSELWNTLNITYDRFVRTTDANHQNVVNQFFNNVKKSGDIYMGNQKGWYCVGCEEFKDISENTERPQCDIHKKDLEWRNEENLFFRLSKYQTKIEQLVTSNDFIHPISRRNEIIKFVSKGLKDFSISRVNVTWGLPVPGYDGHTFYVWFDALLGYLTATLNNGGEYKLEQLERSGWPADLHVIGKDILRFHAIYWPAMCMSAGIDIPTRIYGHGFLTREGNKMGKSLGNVLNPLTLYELVGIDPIRWYLLRDINFGFDGDFQNKRFIDLINNDLANTIGNLLNRTITMSRKWFNNKVPIVTVNGNELIKSKSVHTINIVRKELDRYNFLKASEGIIELAKQSNIYLNDNAPWVAIKNDENYDEVSACIYDVLESTRIIGILLQPLLPNLSSIMLKQLSYSPEKVWANDLVWGKLEQDIELPTPKPIINRLDTNIEI